MQAAYLIRLSLCQLSETAGNVSLAVAATVAVTANSVVTFSLTVAATVAVSAVSLLRSCLNYTSTSNVS